MDANMMWWLRSATQCSNSICSTPVIQAHLLRALEVSQYCDDRIYLAFGNLGRGVFAKRRIEEGEIILVFTGPVIGFTEAVAKGDKECWPLQIGHDRYIDLEEPGCYANHSCNPNAGIVQDRILVAIRGIAKDSEICYDYSTTVDEDHWSMECRCGNEECRHLISDFKYLDPGVRRSYLNLGIVQSFIASQQKDTGDIKRGRG